MKRRYNLDDEPIVLQVPEPPPAPTQRVSDQRIVPANARHHAITAALHDLMVGEAVCGVAVAPHTGRRANVVGHLRSGSAPLSLAVKATSMNGRQQVVPLTVQPGGSACAEFPEIIDEYSSITVDITASDGTRNADAIATATVNIWEWDD